MSEEDRPLADRRRRVRRASARGGRRAADVRGRVKHVLEWVVSTADAVPRTDRTAPLHAAVDALAHANDAHEMRAAIDRLWQEVDRLLADDPLLQLEAAILRLRRQLGE